MKEFPENVPSPETVAKYENFVFPDIDEEIGEFERVAQEYGGKDPEHFLRVFVEKAKQSELVDLTEELWSELENTESFSISRDGWEEIDTHINRVNSETGAQRDWQDLKQKLEQQKRMDAPIVLRFSSDLHVVSGNTRLMVARALGKTPKILLVDMDAGELLRDASNTPVADNSEIFSVPSVEIEPAFASFVPPEFKNDPVGYFERNGKNIKTGEVLRDEQGVVRDDPTAVKDFPVWYDSEGHEIRTVGKRINTTKGNVGVFGDPFHEYTILEHVARKGLPAARPVAKAEQGGTRIMVMERLPGIRWAERNSLQLREQGYSEDDVAALMAQAEQQMNDLKTRFDEAGIKRKWKLQDMVFQIDVPGKRVISVTPTDWERTTIQPA